MATVRVWMDSELRKMYEEGASIREVAEEVGLSQTATRYRLLRGQTKLRAKNGKVKPDVPLDRPR